MGVDAPVAGPLLASDQLLHPIAPQGAEREALVAVGARCPVGGAGCEGASSGSIWDMGKVWVAGAG